MSLTPKGRTCSQPALSPRASARPPGWRCVPPPRRRRRPSPPWACPPPPGGLGGGLRTMIPHMSGHCHDNKSVIVCARAQMGHGPSTVRGRFAPPRPHSWHQCTCAPPLGHWDAPGAAMRGSGQVQHAPALNLLPCDVPFHAASRHPVARRVGGAPVAGGRELSSPGATDVNFRAQDARAVDVLSHRGPALNLLSPWTFRC